MGNIQYGTGSFFDEFKGKNTTLAVMTEKEFGQDFENLETFAQKKMTLSRTYWEEGRNLKRRALQTANTPAQ